MSSLLRTTRAIPVARMGVRAFSTNTELPPIGFIGLGHMGGHMAHNLLKAGHSLVVFDLNPASLDKINAQAAALKRKVYRESSPRNVGANVRTIVSMLPSSPHVEKVYTGDDGVLAGLRSSSSSETPLLIDSSTIDPNVARVVAKKAAEQGAVMIDAPVSGGVGGAENGTLTFMVGGSNQAFESAKPILARMGKNIVHCGDVGTGQVAKVCNNVVLGMSMAAVAEGMALGVKLGMDPVKLAGIMNTSSARCWSSDTYNPCPGVMANVPSSRGYTGGFGTSLMHKDMGLALAAAKSIGQEMPIAQLTEQLYAAIMQQGDGGKDFSFIYQYLASLQKKN